MEATVELPKAFSVRDDRELPLIQDLMAQNTNAAELNGFPAAATISIGAYGVLIFSQDKPGA